MTSMCRTPQYRYPLATQEMLEAEAKMRAAHERAHKAVDNRSLHYTTLDLAICQYNHDAALLFSVLRHEQNYFSTRSNYSGFVAATIMPGQLCRKSLYALCEGRLSERQLRDSIKYLLDLGLLIRQNNSNPFFRQYLWRIDPETTIRAYEAIRKEDQKQKAEQKREARKSAKGKAQPGVPDDSRLDAEATQTSKNAVFSHSDDESHGPRAVETDISTSQSSFFQFSTQKTLCFPTPPFGRVHNEFFSYRVPFRKKEGLCVPSSDDASMALRALPGRNDPEQPPYDGQEPVHLPEVGGPSPQPPIPASPARMAAKTPDTMEAAPTPAQGLAAPPEAVCSSAQPAQSRVAEPFSCETDAMDVTGSAGEESGWVGGETEASPAQAVTVLPETDARERTLDAQLEALERRQRSGEPLRAEVSPAVREGICYAAQRGAWHLPPVAGLMERPQAPLAFEEGLRRTLVSLKACKRGRSQGLRVQIKALERLLSPGFLGSRLAETPRGATWTRAPRWQRLGTEDVQVAVELTAVFFQPKGQDGKKRQPVTTLILLLDLLCGRASDPAEPAIPPATRPTPHRAAEPTAEVKPTKPENPKCLAELARLDNERLLRIEREAEERHAAEQAALLAAEPETQWEQARKGLGMLTKGLLDNSGFADLEERCRAGLISAAALLRALTKPGDRRAVLEAHLGPVSTGHLGAV